MDSFEFLEILDASTALCLLFMCLFMFLFAANDFPHSRHLTFAWSCWCFSCWWWFKKDLGASLQDPTKHIHWPGMADAVWILRLWSLMYALEVVLYLHSAESVQERVLIYRSSAKFNLWLPKCWISRLLLWKCFPQSGHWICFPMFSLWTVFLCRFSEVTAIRLLHTSHCLIWINLIRASEISSERQRFYQSVRDQKQVSAISSWASEIFKERQRYV